VLVGWLHDEVEYNFCTFIVLIFPMVFYKICSVLIHTIVSDCNCDNCCDKNDMPTIHSNVVVVLIVVQSRIIFVVWLKCSFTLGRTAVTNYCKMCLEEKYKVANNEQKYTLVFEQATKHVAIK